MSFFVRQIIWDGTNQITVKAANTAAVAATDTSLVVQINPKQPNLATALNVQEATLDATIVAQGTSASSKILIAGGKSNDATAQYRELPLGDSGRSVIVEGYAGGTAVPISGTVTTQVTQGTRQAVSFTSSTPADTSNTIALVAYANVAVTLHYSGTVTGGQMFFEVSDDNSNWYGITIAPTDDTQTGAAVTNFPVDNYTLSSDAGNITWQMFAGGYAYFRVRMHIQVAGSGTAIVAVIPSTAACDPAPQVTQGITPWVTAGVAASGAAVTGNPVLVAGQDGTDVRTILTDGTGQVKVIDSVAEGYLNTIASAVSGGSFSIAGSVTATPANNGAFVQVVGGSFSTTSTPTQTLPNVKNGDTIVVAISFTSANTITSVTDSAGNVYTLCATSTAINSLKVSMFFATGVIGGSIVATANLSGSSSGEMIAAEYIGTVLLENTSATTGTSATPNQTIASTVVSNSLTVCFVYAQAGSLVPAGSGSTQLGRMFGPRFSVSNYMLSDMTLNAIATTGQTLFNQASSSGFGSVYVTFAIINPANVPITQSNQGSGIALSSVPVVGVGTNGSPAGGVLTIQAASASTCYGAVQAQPTTSPNTISNPFFVQAQAYGVQQALENSQTSATAAGTTNRTTTTGLGFYEDIYILLNITGNGTGTGTLNLYLQDSPDGGTTWNTLVAFNTYTFATGLLTQQQFWVSGKQEPSSITTASSTLLTQGSAPASTQTPPYARQGPWGDRIRVVEVVAGANTVGVIYTIQAVLKA